MSRTRVTLALLTALSVLAACGGDAPDGEAAPAAAPRAATTDVAPAGRIIEITMHTDATGNYFKPAKIEAHRGDVLRFKLATGVHNVNFLADSNPGAAGLPAASAFLQLPGQTLDIKVTWKEGHYYFQCDPHAMLGMVGRLEVEDEDE